MFNTLFCYSLTQKRLSLKKFLRVSAGNMDLRTYLVRKPKTIELVQPMSPAGGAAQAAPTTERRADKTSARLASTESPPHFGAAAAAAAPLEVTPAPTEPPSHLDGDALSHPSTNQASVTLTVDLAGGGAGSIDLVSDSDYESDGAWTGFSRLAWG